MRPSQLFTQWIDEQLRTRKANTPIPSADRLAEQWGISKSTVTRILSRYRQQGDILRIPGKGSFLNPNEQRPEAPVPETQTSVQTIVNEIRHAISTGRLKRGDALPSVKHMATQFRLAPRTVIKAYARLQAQTYVVKIGKTFWVGSFSALTRLGGNRQVLVLTPPWEGPADIFQDKRTHLAYRKLEKELIDHGFGVHYETTDRSNELFRQWRRTDRWPAGLTFFRLRREIQEQVNAFVRRLKRHADPPVTVLYDLDSADYRDVPKGAHMLARGNIDTTFARVAADHIGGRSAQGVSFFYDTDSLGPWNIFTFLKVRTEIKAFDPDFPVQFYVVSRSRGFTPGSFLADLQPGWSAQRQDATMGKYRFTPLEEIKEEIRVVDALDDGLQEAKPGLWAFMEDRDAAQTLAWLRGRHRKVPEGTSVLSFEDGPEAREQGISCCVLDWERTGYLMAHALIGDIPLQRTGKGFIRVAAQVIHRQTTAPD